MNFALKNLCSISTPVFKKIFSLGLVNEIHLCWTKSPNHVQTKILFLEILCILLSILRTVSFHIVSPHSLGYLDKGLKKKLKSPAHKNPHSPANVLFIKKSLSREDPGVPVTTIFFFMDYLPMWSLLSTVFCMCVCGSMDIWIIAFTQTSHSFAA